MEATSVAAPPWSDPAKMLNAPSRPAGSAANRKWSPSGRKIGKRCADSLRAASSLVTGVGSPLAGTRYSGPLASGAKTMMPPAFHAPPRKFVALQITSARPPVTDSVLILPSAPKPRRRLSGDQNGRWAPSPASKPPRRDGIERTDPELRRAQRHRIADDERDHAAVRRDRHFGGIRIDVDAGWSHHRQARDAGVRRLPRRRPQPRGDRSRDDDAGDGGPDPGDDRTMRR